MTEERAAFGEGRVKDRVVKRITLNMTPREAEFLMQKMNDDLLRLEKSLGEWKEKAEKNQAQLDALYGQKFSDRCYQALKSRAETAEADAGRLAGCLKDVLEYGHGSDISKCKEALAAHDAGGKAKTKTTTPNVPHGGNEEG